MVLVSNEIGAIDGVNWTWKTFIEIGGNFSPVAPANENMQYIVAGTGKNPVKAYWLCHMASSLTLYKKNKFFGIVHGKVSSHWVKGRKAGENRETGDYCFSVLFELI